VARFIIQAQVASFYDCGAHKMVSVAVGAPALAREVVDVKTVDALRVEFDRVRVRVEAGGKPYSMGARLVTGERAPRGWKDRRHTFGASNDFGTSTPEKRS